MEFNTSYKMILEMINKIYCKLNNKMIQNKNKQLSKQIQNFKIQKIIN